MKKPNCTECVHLQKTGERRTFAQPPHKANIDFTPEKRTEPDYICGSSNIKLFNLKPINCNNFKQMLNLKSKNNE